MVALAELRAGMLFGELAMFRGETRSATAEVVEPAGAVALLAADMQRLIKRNPDLALKLLASLAERVSKHERAAAPAVLPDRRRPRGERPARADGLAAGRTARRTPTS